VSENDNCHCAGTAKVAVKIMGRNACCICAYNGVLYCSLENRGIVNSGVRPISNRNRMRAIVRSSVISHRGAKVTITPDIHYKFTCYRWVALRVTLLPINRAFNAGDTSGSWRRFRTD